MSLAVIPYFCKLFCKILEKRKGKAGLPKTLTTYKKVMKFLRQKSCQQGLECRHSLIQTIQNIQPGNDEDITINDHLQLARIVYESQGAKPVWPMVKPKSKSPNEYALIINNTTLSAYDIKAIIFALKTTKKTFLRLNNVSMDMTCTKLLLDELQKNQKITLQMKSFKGIWEKK